MPKLIKDDPTSSDVHVDTIMDNTRKKQRRLKKRKMLMEEALKKESKNVPTNSELYARVKTATKAKFDVYPSAYANAWLVAEYKRRGGKYKVAKSDKPLKDPKGGLTQAGRDKYNRETGSKLKAGVKGKADTPEKMRRKGSFLTRFFTNPSGSMIKPNGEPTRLALSAAAWGEPVPKNRSDAASLAAKGRNLLDRYEANKVKKGESAGHPFRGNQWTRGVSGESSKIGPENVEMQFATPFANLNRRYGIKQDWQATVAVEPEKRVRTSKAYEDMPLLNLTPEVKASWDSAEVEIKKQFKQLTEKDGIKIKFVDEDPYTSFLDMHRSVSRTGVLKILRTASTGGHPYWSNETNDMFRAVHDAYGHLGVGRGFDRHGEEAAFQAHKSMFPESAHAALATELRAQNQFMIHNGSFGPQKVGFLPIELQKLWRYIIKKMSFSTSDVVITSDEENMYALGGTHHASNGRNFVITKGESAGHPFRGNQWTRGTSGGNAQKTTSARPKVRQAKNIDDAIKRILNGEIVEVKDVKDIHTVLEKLAEIAKDAKEKGKDAPKYDLCQVSVAGSNLFCGSKLKSKEYPNGVPRIKMPQIGGNPEKGSIADKTFPRNPWDDKEVNGAEPFVAHLKEMGITSKKESVPASSLKASQGELVGSKVAKMMVDTGFDVTKNPLFVSSDGYVIDGHHRWAAAVGRDSSDGKLGNLKMNIIRIDAPISEVLKIANEWTESVGLKPAKGVNKISKREPICIGCQENNTVSKGESAGHPFRGNQWKKVASIHADRIIGQLHGKMSRTHTQMEVEGIMENLAPVIHAAVEQLHSEGASDKPLLVNGKKQSMNGNTVTSRGILDMVADELGVEAVSQGVDFSSKKIFKAGRAGEKDGHPFRGNQHTGGKGGGAKLPSPSKGKPRPKPPMKRGEPQLKTRLTIIDEPSRKKAQKVFEYMIIPARRIKKPNVRAYAVSRTNQMTSGIARPKGMSAKYNMTVDQVRGIEIMLSKIFASGRKKYNI